MVSRISSINSMNLDEDVFLKIMNYDVFFATFFLSHKKFRKSPYSAARNTFFPGKTTKKILNS